MDRRHDILMRIFRNVNLAGPKECWLWQGRDSGNGRGEGYPRMELDGQTVAVHRVLFTCINGYIPSKKQIDHTCANRLCLNPDHLEMVTHKQNQKRKASRKPKATAAPALGIGRQIDLEEYINERRAMEGPAETG